MDIPGSTSDFHRSFSVPSGEEKRRDKKKERKKEIKKERTNDRKWLSYLERGREGENVGGLISINGSGGASERSSAFDPNEAGRRMTRR